MITVSLLVAVISLLVAAGPALALLVGVKDPAGPTCGMWSNDRTRIRARHVEPTRSTLVCRLFAHRLSCCPDHATYVFDPETDALRGVLCTRCGGLIS